MITFTFSVRHDQGEPSGFDLGDITCAGEHGSTSSAGHTPDQGMMIYLSVTGLLDGIRELLGKRSRFDFVGADTSFGLVFRRVKNGITVAAKNQKGEMIARTTEPELAQALLSAAEELEHGDLSTIPDDDAAKQDYLSALHQFRALISQ